MHKIRKITILLFIIFLLINIFNVVYAIDPDAYKPESIDASEVKNFTDKVGYLLGAIRNFSVVVAVISLMIIGFKYIIGSVEEKANYKETLLPYVIGCILAVSGTTLVFFIYNSVR